MIVNLVVELELITRAAGQSRIHAPGSSISSPHSLYHENPIEFLRVPLILHVVPSPRISTLLNKFLLVD